MTHDLVADENNDERPIDLALKRLIHSAKELGVAARSPATNRAYTSDLLLYRDWCAQHGFLAFPAEPQTIALYAAALHEQARAVATIRRRIIAIAFEHKRRALPSPTDHTLVKEVLKGIRRTRGVAQEQKEPLRGDDVKTMMTALPNTPRGWRDRAILVLGYAGAFRRSELAALQLEWVASAPGGVEILLPFSKADQEGIGTRVIIESGEEETTCPVRVLKRYLYEAHITSGPIFRAIDRHGNISKNAITSESIALIVKRHVKHVLGRNADHYGAHSLRAGFATVLDEHGATLAQIMQRGRWKSERVARGYIRSEAWQQPLSGKLGL